MLSCGFKEGGLCPKETLKAMRWTALCRAWVITVPYVPKEIVKRESRSIIGQKKQFVCSSRLIIRRLVSYRTHRKDHIDRNVPFDFDRWTSFLSRRRKDVVHYHFCLPQTSHHISPKPHLDSLHTHTQKNAGRLGTFPTVCFGQPRYSLCDCCTLHPHIGRR